MRLLRDLCLTFAIVYKAQAVHPIVGTTSSALNNEPTPSFALPTGFSDDVSGTPVLPTGIPTSFKHHPTHARVPKAFGSEDHNPSRRHPRAIPRAVTPSQSFTQVVQYIVNPTSARYSTTTLARASATSSWTNANTLTDYKYYTPTSTSSQPASLANHCWPIFTAVVAGSRTYVDGWRIGSIHRPDISTHYVFGMMDPANSQESFFYSLDDTNGQLFRKPVDSNDRAVACINPGNDPSQFWFDQPYNIPPNKGSTVLVCKLVASKVQSGQQQLQCTAGNKSVFGFVYGNLKYGNINLYAPSDTGKNGVIAIELLIGGLSCDSARPTSPSISTFPEPPPSATPTTGNKLSSATSVASSTGIPNAFRLADDGGGESCEE
jgi:hypothetical protein